MPEGLTRSTLGRKKSLLKEKVEKVLMPFQIKISETEERYQLQKKDQMHFMDLDRQQTVVPIMIKNATEASVEADQKKEILYPGNPLRVDIPKEIETMIMSEEFTYDRINKMEHVSAPAAKIIK